MLQGCGGPPGFGARVPREGAGAGWPWSVPPHAHAVLAPGRAQEPLDDAFPSPSCLFPQKITLFPAFSMFLHRFGLVEAPRGVRDEGL